MVKNFKSADSRYYDTDWIPALTLSDDRSGFCVDWIISSDQTDGELPKDLEETASIPQYFGDHWTSYRTLRCGRPTVHLQLPHSRLQ